MFPRPKPTRKVQALLLLASLWLISAKDCDHKVNVFIGTGGKGFGIGSAYPGPSRPFGMARPGPDTASFGPNPGFYHCSGYYYEDKMIRGFSNLRLSGIGVPDYGNVMIMPTLKLSRDYSNEKTYRALHGFEDAWPGSYLVSLLYPALTSKTFLERVIAVELTAHNHSALHRYTFPRPGPGVIVISASHAVNNKQTRGAEILITPQEREVSGKVKQCGSLTGRGGGTEIFFVIRLDQEFKQYGVFADGPNQPGKTAGQGKNVGAYLQVETGPETPVLVRVGLSFISVEQARRNLREEIGDRGFDEVEKEAVEVWDNALSVIEIMDGDTSSAEKEKETIFYTALYHSLLMPTDVTEAGGVYRGLDGKVHESKGRRYYTDFSLWDTFRTLHPLITLIAPDRSADMMQSLTLMAEQGGYMPRWPTAYTYTSCMIGASANNAMADAYLKGVRNFDVEKAYAAMRFLALNPVPESAKKKGFDGRPGLEEFAKLGYVPADKYGGSASMTIEYSYNDFCLAELAKALGKEDDYKLFMARAGNWKNLWDPKSGYLRGKKADGSFVGHFMPSSWTSYYVEGNARQWLWAPLHDVSGLMELMGGPAGLVKRLASFFEMSAKRPDTFLPDFFYWHGNEPDIHAAYLFDLAGRPDLAQKWVRWIMAAKYQNSPAGLDGNDDCGTLSAWFVFSALGFYPVAGTDLYLLGSPLFPKAVIHLPAGDLVIKANGDPAKNIYVRRVTLNGQPLPHPWFKHEEIVKGGELVFEMSSQPFPW